MPTHVKRARNARAPKTPDKTDIEVGRLIRLQRLARSLSQTELANEIGVTFQQVQKYEKGANRISMGRLIRVGRALEVNVSYLLGADMGATPAITPSPKEHAKFAEAVDMLSRFGALRAPHSVFQQSRKSSGASRQYRSHRGVDCPSGRVISPVVHAPDQPSRAAVGTPKANCARA